MVLMLTSAAELIFLVPDYLPILMKLHVLDIV
jgi:hypothetical protein